MCLGAHAVVGAGVVGPGIVVVAVIDALPPAGRRLAPQERHEAPALHRVGDRQAGQVEERRREVDVGHERTGSDALSDARPAGDQGNPQSRLVHEPLVEEAEVAEIPAVVAGVDHDRVVGEPRVVEMVEQPADAVVHALHAGQVVLHEPPILPADEIVVRELPSLHLHALGLHVEPPPSLPVVESRGRLTLQVTVGEVAGDSLRVLGQRGRPRRRVVEQRFWLGELSVPELRPVAVVGRPFPVGSLVMQHEEERPVGRPRPDELDAEVAGDVGAVPLDRDRAPGHEKARVPVVPLAGQHDPAVEAGGIGAEVPLADQARVVAAGAQLLGDRVTGAVEGVEDRNTVGVRILPRQERRPAGRADRVGDERVGELGTVRGEPIEMRGGVDLRAVAGDRMLGMVVGEDEDDVGTPRGLRAGHDRAVVGPRGDREQQDRNRNERSPHGGLPPTPVSPVS